MVFNIFNFIIIEKNNNKKLACFKNLLLKMLLLLVLMIIFPPTMANISTNQEEMLHLNFAGEFFLFCHYFV